MKISAINSYYAQPKQMNKKLNYVKQEQPSTAQPSFRSGKGALWGCLGGAGFGAAMIAMTGGLAAIPLGMAAVATGVYGFVGAMLGDNLSDDNRNNNYGNHPLADGNGFLHIH